MIKVTDMPLIFLFIPATMLLVTWKGHRRHTTRCPVDQLLQDNKEAFSQCCARDLNCKTTQQADRGSVWGPAVLTFVSKTAPKWLTMNTTGDLTKNHICLMTNIKIKNKTSICNPTTMQLLSSETCCTLSALTWEWELWNIIVKHIKLKLSKCPSQQSQIISCNLTLLSVLRIAYIHLDFGYWVTRKLYQPRKNW